jgi:hypothetical protein
LGDVRRVGRDGALEDVTVCMIRVESLLGGAGLCVLISMPTGVLVAMAWFLSPPVLAVARLHRGA